jgi:outer membrane protein TolC
MHCSPNVAPRGTLSSATRGARPGAIVVLALSAALAGALAATPARAQDDSTESPEASDAAPLLTLQDAMALALEHAPTLRVEDDDIAIAEAQRLEASLARWLPALSYRGTISPSGPIRGNALESTSRTDIDAIADLGEGFGYQTMNRIAAVLPLYEFGKITLLRDLAELGVDVARLERRKAELETLFQVQRAYWALQLAREFDDLITEGTDRLQDARQELEDRLFEGDAMARTSLRRLTIFEADFAGRRADNRMLMRLSEQGLRYFTGIEGAFRVTPFEVAVGEAGLPDIDAAMSLALEHRPEVEQVQADIRSRELRARLARRNMAPTLFFTLGFTFNYNPLADDQPTPFAYDPYNSSGLGFALGLDWDFNFRQLAQAQRADRELDRSRHRAEEAVGGLRLEIEEALLIAEGSRERAEAYREAYDAADAWLRQRQIQFDSGLTDFDDLREPLVAYYSTWATYYQALFDYRVARADLALKLGLERLPEVPQD